MEPIEIPQGPSVGGGQPSAMAQPIEGEISTMSEQSFETEEASVFESEASGPKVSERIMEFEGDSFEKLSKLANGDAFEEDLSHEASASAIQEGEEPMKDDFETEFQFKPPKEMTFEEQMVNLSEKVTKIYEKVSQKEGQIDPLTLEALAALQLALAMLIKEKQKKQEKEESAIEKIMQLTLGLIGIILKEGMDAMKAK